MEECALAEGRTANVEAAIANSKSNVIIVFDLFLFIFILSLLFSGGALTFFPFKFYAKAVFCHSKSFFS